MYIVEKAGVAATNGKTRTLDILPKELHDRVRLAIGGKAEVEEATALISQYPFQLRSPGAKGFLNGGIDPATVRGVASLQSVESPHSLLGVGMRGITHSKKAAAARGVGSSPALQEEEDVASVIATPHESVGAAQDVFGNAIVQSALGGSSGALGDAVLGAMTMSIGLGAAPGAFSSNSAMLRAMRRGAVVDLAVERAMDGVGEWGGSALPEPVLERMERAFGHDFGHVRVHTDGPAVQAARALEAYAFALGQHIFFSAGVFDPMSRGGDRVLAHELTHVLQHDEGRLRSPDTGGGVQVSNPTDAMEVEAYHNEGVILDALQQVDRSLATERAQADDGMAMEGLELASDSLEPSTLADADMDLDLAGGLNDETGGEIQRHGSGEADVHAPSVGRALNAKGSGAELPSAIRGRMEEAFGADFGGVRLHTDGAAADAAAALGAHAFTVGQDVYFAASGWAPDSDEGVRLIAHELTHVVQNQRGVESSASDRSVSDPSGAAEQEARNAADQIVDSGDLPEGTFSFGEGERYDSYVEPYAIEVSAAPAGMFQRTDDDTGPVGTPGGDVGSHRGGGTRTSRGARFERGTDGRIRVVMPAADTEHDTGASHSASIGESVETEASASVASGSFGDQAAPGVSGEGTVLGAGADASASAGLSSEGLEVKAEAGVNLTLVSGKLVMNSPELAFDVLGEHLKAMAGVELSASVVAEANAEVGLGLTGGSRVEATATAGGEAFAGARAGVKGAVSLKWQPRGGGWEDVAGASIGAEGWAGAAAACNVSGSLWPVIKGSYSYGVALGFGGSVSTEVEVHAIHAAMLGLTLGARGAAVGLREFGLEYLATGLDNVVDDFYADDIARKGVSEDAHKGMTIPQRVGLVQKMLDGACGDEDEAAILKVFTDAAAGEAAQIIVGIPGGVLRIYEKFDGEERVQMFALLYQRNEVPDIFLDDDLARELVTRGLHASPMTVSNVRRLVSAMLEGFTGDADEGAILRILRDRADWRDILLPSYKERCLSAFNGEEYDALAGFLWLNDALEDCDFDDDVARAVIRQGMHAGVPANKLNRMFDELISGATGDDDEAAIVRLLTDRMDFATSLDEGRLADALSDCDGEEYEDLLVALRRHGRIDLAVARFDVDDNVARKIVTAGVHTSLRGNELLRLVQQLISGSCGDDDEAALIAIVRDCQALVATFLPDAVARQAVLDAIDGDEYDAIVSVYIVYNLLPNLEWDDDVARAAVRTGMHTRVTDATVLQKMIDELCSGFTGDDDEAAILQIVRECPAARPLGADRIRRMIDAIDGDEYVQFVVEMRKNAEIPDVSVDWLTLDDDVARGVVDGVPIGTLTPPEGKRLINAMNSGFTGDDDEARILRLLRESPAILGALSKAEIDVVIDNCDGEEETQLFVLLYENNRLATDPFHADFDDDTAREFVTRGFHRDATKIPVPGLKNLIRKMLEGACGDDDEARILTIINDRRDLFSDGSDPLINDIIAATDGEEETNLFVKLYEIDRLITSPLHADFDDDSARVFVDRGFHTNASKWDQAALVALMNKMYEGSTGDDDEARILKILTDRHEIINTVDRSVIDRMIYATDGEDESKLFGLLWEHQWVHNDLSSETHPDFDDDDARYFVDKNYHRTMEVAQCTKLIDTMYAGATLNEDEARILRILHDKPEVIDGLSQARIKQILDAFNGEEFDQLVVEVIRRAPAKIDVADRTIGIDDNTARALIAAGLHTAMSAAAIQRLVDEMTLDSCGDEDEDAILRLLRERWSDLEGWLSVTKVRNLLAAFDGEQSDRLQAILWEHDKLPSDYTLDDDVARGIVREHLYTGKLNSQIRRVFDALIEGFSGDDDEACLLQLIGDQSAFLGALSDGDITLLISNFDGEEESRLLVLLLGAHKIQLSDSRIDDNAVRELVRGDTWQTFPVADKATLINRLLAGATMQEDEVAILRILRAGDAAGIMGAGVSLEALIAGFQAENYHELVKLLYEASVQRDTVMDTHVNGDCAQWLAWHLPTGITMAHKGTLVRLLSLDLDSDHKRAVMHLFQEAPSGIPTLIDAAGWAAIRPGFTSGSDEDKEVLALVFEHDASRRDDLLASPPLGMCAKLGRVRAYDRQMSNPQRWTFIQRLLAVGENDLAVEVVQFCKDGGHTAALISAAGGEAALTGAFVGRWADDVRQILAAPAP